VYTPLVTVVTPTYNAAQFVARCVESVLAQTYARWELIVADDGSTDGTPDLVERYRDPRIRVLRLPHRGLRAGALAATYNAALAAGEGELVAVLEGDDFWPADKLEVQVAGFADPAVQLSWGAGAWVEVDEKLIEIQRLAPEGSGDVRLTTAELFQRLLREYVTSPSITVMARRSALDRIGGFRQDGSSHYVDFPTWLPLLATSPGVALWHDHLLGSWRRYPHQTTSRFGPRMRRERWRVVREVVKTLDTAALAQVGWTPELARANWAEWAIGCGRAALRAGRYARARRIHASVLARGPGIHYRAKGLGGLLSASAGMDLPGAWRRLRIKLRGR
jgi:glycosyltransferase involved in cell wall biosynthesis